jgi:AAA domain-containing protein
LNLPGGVDQLVVVKELGFRITRRWFKAIQPDPAMATYTDLKGRENELDLRSESWVNAMIEQLRRDRIDVVVIDPISAVCAAIGVDENANAEVRPLLDRIDAVVREAGCKGVLVVHHTGHDGSRFVVQPRSVTGLPPSGRWSAKTTALAGSGLKAATCL